MPNGRSGGFTIKRKQLMRILKEFNGSKVIGTAFATPDPMTAEAVIEILKNTWTWGTPIGVEEQDHKYYVLHLSEWFSVDASSPLYTLLLDYHISWVKAMAQKRKK